MTVDNRRVKYIVLLVVCLLIMMFGSVLVMPILLRPLMSMNGYSRETIATALGALQNYFSDKPYNETQTWHEFAVEFFGANSELFANIKTFFCAIQFFSYIPLLIVIIIFLRKECVEDFISFKKNIKKNLLWVLIGIGFMYASIIIINVIYNIIGITGESNNESIIGLLLDSPGVVLMVISVVLLAPITEEIIFRKLLFGTAEITFKFHPVVAIIFSCLVFSFIHVTDLESLKYIFQYIALALPICVVYHYSGNNIYVTIIMHIINNLISVIATLIQL